MPTESISMRKLKEILRLKYQAKLSHRKIAKSLSISPSTISNYITRAKMMGLRSGCQIQINHIFIAYISEESFSAQNICYEKFN